ncbi:hypothetical protein [uncultured Cellulomonas sp.]|uniref:hypothetical protein n=1 Tax=uncultured Cellulomonas sp. TaxID=189682 RepID=UPI00261D3111|nr:hypothetical protein [uncultured Cellulomonas sp.]
MALIALASAKGAPGVTTAALALAMVWPRSVLLVEADLAGTSVMPGYYRALVPHDRGLHQLAIAHSHGDLTDRELWDQTMALDQTDTQRAFLPGILKPRSAASLRDLWGPLASHLAALEAGGVDVIVDLGRIQAREDREPLLTVADLVLLTTSSRLPDVVMTQAIAADRVSSSTRAVTNLALLVVGPGRPYTEQQIAKHVGLTSVGTLAWDQVSAQVLSVGTRPTGQFTKSPLMRTATTVADQIGQHITQRRDQLDTKEPR